MNDLELDLSGSPFEIGFGHGRALREEVRRSIAVDGDVLESPWVVSYLDAARRILQDDVPSIYEELTGLAAGANVSIEQALLLQYRREIARYRQEIAGGPSRAPGECTSFASLDALGRPVLAQNVDVPAFLGPLGHVFRISPGDRAQPRALMFSFAGLLGFAGLNEMGLAIGINLVLSDGWRPGVSPYLLVRHLLRLSDVETCITELQRIRRSSSRCIILCDGTRLAAVEMTAVEMRVIRGTTIHHTNHYLHPELERADRMNIFTRNASRLRLDTLRALTADAFAMGDSAEALFGVLSDHSLYPVGLCAHADGDQARDETVACVVIEPAARRMLLRKGHPCSSITRTFSL